MAEKNFKTAVKSVGRNFLKKPLDSGDRKKQICKTNHSVAKRPFFNHFPLIKSSNFWCQSFLAASRNLGVEIPVVDGDLSYHKVEISPKTSLDENCIEFEFQTDGNYCVYF